MGSNESTANLAAVGAALAVLLVWVLGLVVPPPAMVDFPDGPFSVLVTWAFCRYVPTTLDPLRNAPPGAGAAPGAALVLLVAMLLPGCAVTWTLPDGASIGAYTGLAPSDEIQTLDVSIIGISVDATRQSVDIGYKKARMTRIPSYEKPSLVPSVRFDTTVTSDGVTDKLEVGEKR